MPISNPQPYTASLTWRCMMRNAASYVQFVTETDQIILKLWAGDYKTGDIKQWARDRIESIQSRASQLLPLFANDEKLYSDALSAVADSLEELARTDCLFGNVPGVGIMKTSKMVVSGAG